MARYHDRSRSSSGRGSAAHVGNPKRRDKDEEPQRVENSGLRGLLEAPSSPAPAALQTGEGSNENRLHGNESVGLGGVPKAATTARAGAGAAKAVSRPPQRRNNAEVDYTAFNKKHVDRSRDRGDRRAPRQPPRPRLSQLSHSAGVPSV